MSRLSLSLPVAVVALILISSVPVPQRASSNGIPIQYVVVIVQENHSFDNYFGTYPGANGLPPGVVPPPQVDKYGYGFRVPCLDISPYAKRGFIDPTPADHSSILKFIETLFNLQPLATRDAAASNLMEAFDFSQKARAPLILPGSYLPEHYPLTPLTSPPNTGRAAADAKSTGATILITSQPISGGDLESSLVLGIVVLGVVAALRRFGRWRW